MNYIIFILIGFTLGSTMFAYWLPKLFKKIDICELPKDHNPGVANAYTYAGFGLGTLALVCELGKGFLPVLISQRFLDPLSLPFAFVIAAPVLGHAFPFLQKNRGGKAIAVSFGVLIGLYPEVRPLFYLIVFYLFFSLIVIITPHSLRSIVTFGLFAIMTFLRVDIPSIRLGCFLIAVIVIFKHFQKEDRSTSTTPHVRFL